MKDLQKTIGTLVPVSAIFSSEDQKGDRGTFASGLIFLDWLKKNHQSAWQILPLYQTQLEPGSATKHIPSPYKGYGIGLDPKYLPSAFMNDHPTKDEMDKFTKTHSEWIGDYALFCALRDHFGTDDWREWGKDLMNRDAKALRKWTDQLKEELNDHILMQWRLHKSYNRLRAKAKKLGIALIGDLPFFITLFSPLVWAHQEVFQLDKDGHMQYVSGVLNSSTASFGRQLWGHPLYNWDLHRGEVLAFWKIRLQYLATLFDTVRFDHAKAFFEYGAMDIRNDKYDSYKKGPGPEAFKELISFCKRIGLLVFAEDSGNKIEELRRFLKIIKVPGIKILRFALKKDDDTINEKYANIANYPENCVAYTTTHDTETLLGYLHELTSEQKQKLATAAGVPYDASDKVLAINLRNAVLASPAHMVIIPIQDWLLITDRINIPGTELPVNDPNWNFRLQAPIEELSIKS